MDDTIEWSEWWLPGRPKRRVKGALTFDPAEGASLTLIETLPELRAAGLQTGALLGHGFDGTELTLLYPFLTGNFHRTTSTGAWNRSMVVAPTLLCGGHIEDPEALVFKDAIVRFAGLRDACLQAWPSDLSGEWEPWVGPDSQARAVRVEGGTLLFRQHEDHRPGIYTNASEIDIEVVISSEKAHSLSDFDEQWLSPLEALTMLVARGALVLCSGLPWYESTRAAPRHRSRFSRRRPVSRRNCPRSTDPSSGSQRSATTPVPSSRDGGSSIENLAPPPNISLRL